MPQTVICTKLLIIDLVKKFHNKERCIKGYPSEYLEKKVHIYCESSGLSISALVCTAVKQYLNIHEPLQAQVDDAYRVALVELMKTAKIDLDKLFPQ